MQSFIRVVEGIWEVDDGRGTADACGALCALQFAKALQSARIYKAAAWAPMLLMSVRSITLTQVVLSS